MARSVEEYTGEVWYDHTWSAVDAEYWSWALGFHSYLECCLETITLHRVYEGDVGFLFHRQDKERITDFAYAFVLTVDL
jgi:hypothetical protein